MEELGLGGREKEESDQGRRRGGLSVGVMEG